MQEKRGNRGVEMSGQRIKKIDTSEKDFEVYTQVKDAVCMIDIETVSYTHLTLPTIA